MKDKDIAVIERDKYWKKKIKKDLMKLRDSLNQDIRDLEEVSD